MALSDLLAEIVASAVPGPNTDRGMLLLILPGCVVVAALHVASPSLIAEGIMPSEWQPHVIAALVLVSAAAVVVGFAHLVRRTVGAVLPCICLTAGLAGGWIAWFL